MEKNFIPNFKRSNESLSKDILKLKKIEAISDGWYRGQLKKYLEKTAGKVIIDGIECYDTDIIINSYTYKNDNSQKAKDIKKLLELFGISEIAMDSIYETSIDESVDGILLNFNKNNNSNREYSEFDFKQAYNSLIDLISVANSFELVQTNKTYSLSEIDRNAVASYNIYSGTAWIIDEDYFDELQEYTLEGEPTEIIRDFSLGQAMHFSELKILNYIGEDITSEFPSQVVKALKCILVVSGGLFLQLDSLTKLSEEMYYNSIIEEYVFVVKSKETYSNIKISSFLDTQFDRYKNGDIKTRIENNETYEINGILANNLWSFYLVSDYLDNDLSNDLFYISKKKRNVFGKLIYDEDLAKRYITVNGLKKTNVKIIASYISQYADFQILKKRKKRKFLGIGGIVGNVLGGFFELALSAIEFISEILYFIPIVRIQIQAIAWIFSGEWSNDKERFIQVSTRIIIAVIAAVITFLTAGAGWQLAVSLLSSAYTVYTGIQKYDELVEIVKQKQLENNTIADSELYNKVVDLSNDEDIVKTKNEIMYKPFTEINNNYRNTFNKGGIYDIKYGI